MKNRAGTIIYPPPQSGPEVENLMAGLERFIHADPPYDADPLVRMALINHQFESIHPFHDGNGRTGRILNVLYLVKEGLLDVPVLYLSRPTAASYLEALASEGFLEKRRIGRTNYYLNQPLIQILTRE